MKKNRNTFFTDNINYPTNILPQNTPLYQGQFLDTNLESRLSKIERQINRLEYRLNRLENTSASFLDNDNDSASNMYML